MKLTSFFGAFSDATQVTRSASYQSSSSHTFFLLFAVSPSNRHSRGENFETSGGNKKTQHDEGYLNVGFIDEAHRLQDILSDTTTYPVFPRRAAERADP